MDPRAGQFTQPDPSADPDPGAPQMLNRYAYVYNNPTSMVDPTGLWGMQGNNESDNHYNGGISGGGVNGSRGGSRSGGSGGYNGNGRDRGTRSVSYRNIGYNPSSNRYNGGYIAGLGSVARTTTTTRSTTPTRSTTSSGRTVSRTTSSTRTFSVTTTTRTTTFGYTGTNKTGRPSVGSPGLFGFFHSVVNAVRGIDRAKDDFQSGFVGGLLNGPTAKDDDWFMPDNRRSATKAGVETGMMVHMALGGTPKGVVKGFGMFQDAIGYMSCNGDCCSGLSIDQARELNDAIGSSPKNGSYHTEPRSWNDHF